jgi:hypothetical protein
MAANKKTTKNRLRKDQPPPEANGMPAAADAAGAAAPPKGKRAKAVKPQKGKKEPKPKKTSALDAAARVLAKAGTPMNCQEMIAAVAAKDYWTSPGGKTPSATLYSAILRELKIKKSEARFRKDRARQVRAPRQGIDGHGHVVTRGPAAAGPLLFERPSEAQVSLRTVQHLPGLLPRGLKLLAAAQSGD